MGCFVEVLHTLHHFGEELDAVVSVLVLDISAKAPLILGELLNQTSEQHLRHVRKGIVVHADHCGSALAIVDQGDLAKVVALVESPHSDVLAVSLLDSDFAVALTNEVQNRPWHVLDLRNTRRVSLDQDCFVRQFERNVKALHDAWQKVVHPISDDRVDLR